MNWNDTNVGWNFSMGNVDGILEVPFFWKLEWTGSVCLCVFVFVVLWCDWNVNVHFLEVVCACYVVVLQKGPGAHNTWLSSWTTALCGPFYMAHGLTMRPKRACTLCTLPTIVLYVTENYSLWRQCNGKSADNLDLGRCMEWIEVLIGSTLTEAHRNWVVDAWLGCAIVNELCLLFW